MTTFGLPDYAITAALPTVQAAQAKFQLLVQQYIAANIVRGITTSGKVALIGNAVGQVAFWGAQGSLWQCYKAVGAIVITPEMAPFLTEDIREEFKNKLIAIISSL